MVDGGTGPVPGVRPARPQHRGLVQVLDLRGGLVLQGRIVRDLALLRGDAVARQGTLDPLPPVEPRGALVARLGHDVRDLVEGDLADLDLAGQGVHPVAHEHVAIVEQVALQGGAGLSPEHRVPVGLVLQVLGDDRLDVLLILVALVLDGDVDAVAEHVRHADGLAPLHQGVHRGESPHQVPVPSESLPGDLLPVGGADGLPAPVLLEVHQSLDRLIQSVLQGLHGAHLDQFGQGGGSLSRERALWREQICDPAHAASSVSRGRSTSPGRPRACGRAPPGGPGSGPPGAAPGGAC